MVDADLQQIVHKLARCTTHHEVGAIAVDAGGQCFGSHITLAITLDYNSDIRGCALDGVRDVDFENWSRHCRPHDQTFHAALGRARPVHNGQLYRADQWANLPCVVAYGRRLGIEYYMAIPIFGSRGYLTGMVITCRRRQDRPFNERWLSVASVLAGFLSATLARVSEHAPPAAASSVGKLSPRELQIARLVADGRNNLEVALQLGIARDTVKQTLGRVYDKLQVRGRAAMASKLAASHILAR